MSDLSKYCVRIGERSSKRRFPISNYVVFPYRAVMAVGVGILYDLPILYFVLLAINVFDLYPQSLRLSCESL